MHVAPVIKIRRPWDIHIFIRELCNFISYTAELSILMIKWQLVTPDSIKDIVYDIKIKQKYSADSINCEYKIYL